MHVVHSVGFLMGVGDGWFYLIQIRSSVLWGYSTIFHGIFSMMIAMFGMNVRNIFCEVPWNIGGALLGVVR